MSVCLSDKNISIEDIASQLMTVVETEGRGEVRTRFAPSPTGVLHIGSVRTALFNYLFARKNKGKFILRIEDTDKERSRLEYEEDIKKGLEWLGLEWNEFYRQSERLDIYQKYLQKLLDEGKVYVSKETEGDRKKVIRFKNPNKKVVFDDYIRGNIEFDTTELGDFVIAKDLNSPLFHFAVVVDDFEMKISHIIRGEDHISNTPRQILIQEALGFNIPFYAHIPLILGEDRSKLSKRHGAVSLNAYCDEGYLPDAIINFLAFLGWNPGTEKEIFSREELEKEFSLERIQKSGAIFNIVRLNWLNQQYIKNIDENKLGNILLKFLPELWQKQAAGDSKMWQKIVKLEKERLEKLSDVKQGIEFFFEELEYKKNKLLWEGESDIKMTKQHLKKVLNILEQINLDDFVSRNIKEKIWPYAEKEGRGNVLWPFRMALTSEDKSPDPFIVADILGKEKTLKRLKNAIAKI